MQDCVRFQTNETEKQYISALLNHLGNPAEAIGFLSQRADNEE